MHTVYAEKPIQVVPVLWDSFITNHKGYCSTKAPMQNVNIRTQTMDLIHFVTADATPYKDQNRFHNQ